MRSAHYPAKHVLWTPEDEITGLTFVVEGRVDCLRRGELVESISSGMLLFPMAALEPVKPGKMIVTRQPTMLLHLGEAKLRKLSKRKPWLGRRVLRNLATILGKQLIQK